MKPEDIVAARARRDAFIAAVPKAILDLEDALPEILAKAPGSKRAKLKRIYLAMDQIAKVREPFVACGKGCSDCCKMNISISRIEARAISSAAGRPFADLTESRRHPDAEFVGVPCPFLVDDACSIYEHRPIACRKHASFHSSSEWCKPDMLFETTVPMLDFGGVDKAFLETSTDGNQLIVADVRDFFPV